MVAKSYQEHIIPVVDIWMQRTLLQTGTFMQDNAPCYKARSTIAEPERRGIQPIKWPAFSPDLNPMDLQNYKGREVWLNSGKKAAAEYLSSGGILFRSSENEPQRKAVKFVLKVGVSAKYVFL